MIKKLEKRSKIVLFPLAIRKEGENFIIGRKDTETYISTSIVGYTIIKHIKQGKNFGDINHSIKNKYGDFNVLNFIKNLIKLGFIKKIDDSSISNNIRPIRPLFKLIKSENIRWIFSPYLIIFFLAIILFSIYLIIKNPEYVPTKNDFFFTQAYIILIPLTFILTWLLVFIHEFAHFLAARSHNLISEFGIGNRLYYLVAITDITNIYSLERNKRFRVLFSGIFMDLLILSISIILIHLSDLGMISTSILGYKLLKFIILAEFLGIMWQFLFYMKTDMYYIFENLFGVYNLYPKTKMFLKKIFRSVLNKNHHVSAHFDSLKEKRIVQLYSIFFTIGIFISVLIFFNYHFPITLNLLINSFHRISFSLQTHQYSLLLDSGVLIMFISINLGLFLYALLKHNKFIHKPVLYWPSFFLLILVCYSTIYFAILMLLNFFIINEFFYLVIAFSIFIFFLLVHWLKLRLQNIVEE